MGTTGPASPREETGAAIGRGIGRVLEVAFSVFAIVVFIILWVYVSAAVFTDGALLADTWAWISGLEPIAAVMAWLVLLPVAVFVWAWQADLSPLIMGVVLVGLVAWTFVAFWSPLKRLVGRTV